MYKKLLLSTVVATIAVGTLQAKPIIHDAEQGILQKQFGKEWAKQDIGIDEKLKALEKKFGKKPNIIHIMWDDNSFGEVGIPALNQTRGYDTPRINQMAEDGILFTRMYSEPSCTPTRTAALTGRLAVRAGMYTVAFPPEGAGLNADEVTIAEILSEAGYSTAFYGKGHQGDIEEAYMHNQGFDEAQFSMYNQFPPMFWNRSGEAAGLTNGYTPIMQDKKYLIDDTFHPYGYIMDIEGKKGGLAKETVAPNTIEDYRKVTRMHQEKALDFIRRKAKNDKPFYLAYWPNLYDFTLDEGADKITTSHATMFAQNMVKLDTYIGQILDELKAQGIEENTLVIAMADNGPMKGIPGAFTENIFRGGKGQHLEGAVRVPAFAVWPGMIAAKQNVGDMISVHDLFTTFAKIGGGTKYIPRDRVIDGIDQTAMLLEGDGNSRRDYIHIYTGPHHAATIKQQFKRVWLGNLPGLVGPSFFNLYHDPREMHPMMAQFLWAWGPFDMMKTRHDDLIAKYPFRPVTHGMPFGGITNLRPETIKFLKNYEDALKIQVKK